MEENKEKTQKILQIIEGLANKNGYYFKDNTGDYNSLTNENASGSQIKKILDFQEIEIVNARLSLHLEITFISRCYTVTFGGLNESKRFSYSDSDEIKMRGVVDYWLGNNGKLPLI
jgi:hypothetical protein